MKHCNQVSATFNERLSRLRKQHDMTQQELADQLGVTRSTVAKYENQFRVPGMKILRKLSSIFGVTVDELIKDQEEFAHDVTERDWILVRGLIRRTPFEELLRKVEFQIDGIPLTEEEAQEVAIYIRTKRMMGKLRTPKE